MNQETIGGSYMAKHRLQNFVREWLNNQWDEAAHFTKDVMESMGWIPFKINRDRFYEFMDQTFLENIDGVVNSMIDEAKKCNKKFTEDDIVELLLWYLTGSITKKYLEKYNQLADNLGSILSNNSANWIAEGFSKSRI
jgi:hypothetical protein